jgi:arsenite methyltransferase
MTNGTKNKSCCNAEQPDSPRASTTSNAHVHERVREGYSAIAKKGIFSVVEDGSQCAPGGGCCGATALSPTELAVKIGYTHEELTMLPEGANMGLSCGNPAAIAALKSGEVLIDLGSGGGFDCFLAGPKVGPTGRVIGVDMTPEMITKARNNVEIYAERTGLKNVEFRLGEIEHLPVPDASVDVVISNCVINLSPNKPQVWREMYRALKPGGRIAVSDLALKRDLPPAVMDMVEALIGCVAGASLVDDIRRMAQDAGFRQLQITEKPDYIDAMTNFQDPLYQRIMEALPPDTKPCDYVVSLDISAVK